MNILLISQCDKRALVETRRILDQFAERRGERTWQTPITKDGLDTLRKLLKKTARKNTAVACHWIRGLDHSELLWVVGDSRRFNAQGAVPTNTTSRDILRQQDENDWHTKQDIHLLTAMAALLHDLGKASAAFQARLKGELRERNQYRHEWASLRLFEAFVGQDDDASWLNRLMGPTAADDLSWLARERLHRDGLDEGCVPPFRQMQNAPLAQAIGWLVVSHHRLPEPRWTDSDGQRRALNIAELDDVLLSMDAIWNEQPTSDERSVIEPYWHFPAGLPVTTPHWRERSARVAKGLLKLVTDGHRSDWLGNPFVMHLSRLSLMLADHYYSSLDGLHPERLKVPDGYPLYANTSRDGGMNQTLDEHLVGVARHSSDVTHALPRFEEHLPRLGPSRKLRQRSKSERFRWQDKAADLANTMRVQSMQEGAFIVNMASTGCGKTMANARIMHALADPAKGMRCSFALGLRTLTLQTGRSFRDLLGLGEDELAVRVGGAASTELLKHYEQQAETTGSASRQLLMTEEEGDIDYLEGNEDTHPLLRRVMHDASIRKLLAAPLLVCTVDHLTPATESQRGGRQIAPMLRLMSSDLVLDEPDDFDMDDLPALTRLVHWAGLLGSRVLLSSATLPPALIQGLFMAYRSGRQQFLRNRGAHPGVLHPEPRVCCLWVDEFHQAQADCANAEGFVAAHLSFVQKRSRELTRQGQQGVNRRAQLIPLALKGVARHQLPARIAERVLESVCALHKAHHSVDPISGKRVSFGLVRMANIEPLVEVARALYQAGAPEGMHIHLCTYHSQYPLLLRSLMERTLDGVLNRQDVSAVFSRTEVRECLSISDAPEHVFIVLGSPVTEVGRDHDYDWAVVEPSSMRSLIQLAGRVKRHRRDDVCHTANIHIFDTCIKTFTGRPDQAVFCRPGFESDTLLLSSHHLTSLLESAEYEYLDARPRILARSSDQLQPRASFVDLEHARMQGQMLASALPAGGAVRGRRANLANPPVAKVLNASTWWALPPKDALLTYSLQQAQPFRKNTGERVDLVLMPNDEGSDYELRLITEVGRGRSKLRQESVIEVSMNHRVPDGEVHGERISAWAQADYMEALASLAEEKGGSLETCARRYGTVTLRQSRDGWWFHPALGFTVYRR